MCPWRKALIESSTVSAVYSQQQKWHNYISTKGNVLMCGAVAVLRCGAVCDRVTHQHHLLMSQTHLVSLFCAAWKLSYFLLSMSATTDEKTQSVCSFLMVVGLSVYCLVDPQSFCPSECNRIIDWECVCRSVAIQALCACCIVQDSWI